MEQNGKPLKVAIVSASSAVLRLSGRFLTTKPQIGGSLTGLMCGIMLKHAGHSVTIVEQNSDERESYMAGVCLGPSGGDFLARHDRLTDLFYHRTSMLQILNSDGNIKFFFAGRRDITSWDTYYFRLRSLFDGYLSSYNPQPPLSRDTDGSVFYKSRTKVLDITRESHSGSKVVLSLVDCNSDEISQMEADLIIGADGPDSFVRSKYLPDVKRRYMGYVAWRGIVPESDISVETRELLDRGAIVHRMDRHHCIMYIIPGINGSLEPGERFLNFLWYTNESRESLDDIMIDGIDGHRHHNIVPAGRIRGDIWSTCLERATAAPFPAPFLEAITKIQRPFLQVITEFCSPHAAFEHGKVLLIGDALSLFCPHTALSSTQAAFHTRAVEDYVTGKLSLEEWERKVLTYSRLYWSQSVWWGRFYQQHIVTALPSGLYYWAYYSYDRARSWWNNLWSQSFKSSSDEYIT